MAQGGREVADLALAAGELKQGLQGVGMLAPQELAAHF